MISKSIVTLNEMIGRKQTGPRQKKLELSKNIRDARQSYIDVENFVLDFMKTEMVEIIKLQMKRANDETGNQIYFVCWTENKKYGPVKFMTEPLDYEIASEVFAEKDKIMNK